MANLKMIRHRLLHCRYGKFDEVENLFRKTELLSLKPRIIWERMVAKLQLESGDVNRVSFYSWLSRYRSKNALLQVDNTNEKPWQEFKITDPVMVMPNTEDEINFTPVHYKNNNL